MANLKNWLPDMTDEEMYWFDKCPKAVLFEIARQFGMRVADSFTAEGAFATMKNEWDVLHTQHLVPQKPPKAYAPKIVVHRPAQSIREIWTAAKNKDSDHG